MNARSLLLATTCLLLTSLGWAPGCPAAPSPSALSDTSITARPTAQKFFVRGMTEVSLGDYTEAISHFETALEHAPQSAAVLQALADAHSAQGNPTTALFYARKARKFGGMRAYYHHRLAEIQRAAGSPEAALQTYRDLLDRFPSNVKAYRALARLQIELERPQAALKTYDALLEHHSVPPVPVLRTRLSLYRQTGDSTGVRHTLQALLDRRPNVPRYRRQLAHLYAQSGQPSTALDLLKPLAEDYPNDQSLQRQLQRLARKTGQTISDPGSSDTKQSPSSPESLSPKQLVARAESLYTDATVASPPDTSLLRSVDRHLTRALQQKPAAVDALLLRARILEQWGKPLQAGRALKQALSENPRAPERWGRAAEAYLDARRYKDAASVAKEGLLLFPGQYPLIRVAAFAHLRLRDAKKAISHFQSALKLRPDQASSSDVAALKAGLGVAHSLLGQTKNATELLREALSLAPNHPVVLDLYASHLTRQNEQLERALQLAQRAVEQAPENADYLDTLGWVHFQRGNLTAAKQHLRAALKEGPASVRLLEHYGDVEKALGNESTAREYWQKALDRAPNRDSLRKKLGLESNA